MTQANKAFALASVAVLSWSTVATSFKIALRELTVFEMLLVASVTALAVFTVAMTVKKSWSELRRISPSVWTSFALLGLVNPVAYYLILFRSYDLLPAQIAQPINYVWPILLLVLIALFTRSSIPAKKYIGMLISLAGVTYISAGGKDIEGSLSTAGILMALGSAALWAVYWLMNDRLKHSVSETVSLFLGFLFGTVYLLIACIFVPVSIDSASGLLSGVYIGLFEMGIPFICFGSAIRLTRNPALVNQMCYLAPFLSLFIISVVLREPIVSSTYIGLALIVGGLIFNQFIVPEPKSGTKSQAA